MNIDPLIVNQIYKSYVMLGCKTAVLTRTSESGADPGTGVGTETTLTATPLFKLDASSLKTLGYIFDANLIQGGDVLAKIPAKNLPFEPLPGDAFLTRGLSYQVIDVKPDFAPGSTPTEYSLLVRK